jgi:drug/metabolite transporter (DMT)-like permease
MSFTSRQLALLVALTLIWGANWPLMKFSLREIGPLWFRAITMTGGSLLLLVFYRARGVDMRMAREHLPQVALLGLPNVLGWHLFSILGLTLLASGRAATLGFTMPVWTVLLAVLVGLEHMRPRVVLGATAALAAVALLSAQEWQALAGRPMGVLWMQLAALCWASGTLMMRRTRLPMSTEAVTVWMMLMSSVVFWLLAVSLEAVPDAARWSPGLWASLAWGVVMNYGVAQIIWFGMAREMPPTASAFSIMAVPLLGTLGAPLIVGETPVWQDGVAAACVMLAIASVLLPGRRATPAATPG